jgi:hypothetical protein
LVAWLVVAQLFSASALLARDSKKTDLLGEGPIGVCYPVAGTGHIFGRASCTPIGPLSPVFEGDTVVVRQGHVTLVDVRSGERKQLASQESYVLRGGKPTNVRGPWARLGQALNEVLRGPDLRKTGGSVRSVGGSCFWPDSARFAEGVPVTFQWCNVHTEPTVLRLTWAGGATNRTPLTGRAIGISGMEWPSGVPKHPGRVRWSLLDADGNVLGGGRFEILSPADADSARARFDRAARGNGFDTELGLGAALLAAKEHFYLW